MTMTTSTMALSDVDADAAEPLPVLMDMTGTQPSSLARALIWYFRTTMDHHAENINVDGIAMRQLADNSVVMATILAASSDGQLTAQLQNEAFRSLRAVMRYVTRAASKGGKDIVALYPEYIEAMSSLGL